MEISVEKMKPINHYDDKDEKKKGYKKDDLTYSYESFTVWIGNHRILTIVTSDEMAAKKWLTEALRTSNLNASQLLVGLSMERSKDRLIICFGNQCLILNLLALRRTKLLAPFFSDSKVILAGTQMEKMKMRLEKVFQVKVSNAVDLNELALKVTKRDELDLAKYSLDKVAKLVLGKHVTVNRSVKYGVGEDMVVFATVDGFLSYRAAYELLNKNGKKMKGKKKIVRILAVDHCHNHHHNHPRISDSKE